MKAPQFSAALLQARVLYHQAAEGGFVEAFYTLGRLLEDGGEGETALDEDAAQKYYEMVHPPLSV